MTKPAITNRVTKGAALTYAELDTNFSNLQNATIGVTDGTNTHAFNLNDTITFTAGTNVTLGVNPSTGAITIAASGGVTTGNIQWTYNSTSKLNTMNAWVNSDDALKIQSSAMELNIGAGLVVNCSSGSVTLNTGFPDSNIQRVFTDAPLTFGSTVSSGYSQIESYQNTATYNNNTTVDFPNFSGMILVNRQDSSGNVALWILGSGAVLKLGDSTGSAVSGTFTHVSGINGYRWTNNTGGAVTVNFFAIKTRSGA